MSARELNSIEPYRDIAPRGTVDFLLHHALTHWLHHYTWHRPHSAVGGRPPITRVVSSADNLVRLHS